MKWIFALVIFSLLILIHEFGHFIVAKLCGVAVVEFSMGFGPRLLTTVKGGTRYSLKALPFGGSCQMKGMMDEDLVLPENGGEDEDGKERPADPSYAADGDSFNDKSVGKRAAIIFAGPLFNFLLAFFASVILISVMGYDPSTVTHVLSEECTLKPGDRVTSINGKRIAVSRDVDNFFLFHPSKEGDTLTVSFVRDGEKRTETFPVNCVKRYMMGITYQATAEPAFLTSVGEGTPAYAAGLRADDEILRVNGTAITSGEALQEYMSEYPLDGTPIVIGLRRGSEELDCAVTPEMTTTVNPGFYCYADREKTGPVGVLKYSFTEIRYWIGTVLGSLRMLFTGRAGVKDLSGPVGVVTIISDTYEEAKPEGALMVWMNMLYLLILLSANLGVMNLLPLPAIDGGRLVFLLTEAVTGRAVSRKVEGVINFVGMALLFLLMFFVMYNDILRLFR